MRILTRSEYLRDPCAASALPFWKTARFEVPADMLVIRDDLYDKEAFPGYSDDPYFKLVHRLENVEKPVLPQGFCEAEAGFAEFSAHIRRCYGGGPDAEELAGYALHPVYDPTLWVALADESGGIAASGVAELDAETGEGALEWIQVSPGYRGRGLGGYLVRELLWRLKCRAAFVTVSGRVGNETDPLGLYLACGFGNKTIWHVLKKDRDLLINDRAEKGKLMDVSYVTGKSKFNYRVCAVIVADGKILAMHDERSPYYYLPGGRVKLGETAEEAVLREVREELDDGARIVRPLWLCQSFFTEDVDGLDYHELCLYFLVDVSRTRIPGMGERFTLPEGRHTHDFEWLEFSRLKDEYFYPLFLKTEIFRLPESLTLITSRE